MHRSLRFLTRVGALALCLVPAAGRYVVAQTRTVEGVVVRAGTNEPIVGADVTARLDVSAAERSAAARTGATSLMQSKTGERGQFSIPVIDGGQYRLSAKAPGFGEQYFGSRTGRLFDGSVRGVVLALNPAGSISGRVMGADGVALTGMYVTLLFESYDDTGSKLLRETASAATDDRGEYRFGDVLPGRYYVRVHSRETPRASAGSPGGRATRVEPSRTVPPTFFPSSPTIAAASPVDVSGGTEAKAINIVCPRVETFGVRGTIVLDATGAAPAAVAMSLMNKDTLTSTPVSPAIYKGNGIFEFTGITPGAYWLSGMLLPAAGARDRGEARLVRESVEISTGDLQGIQLALPPLLSLDGKLSVEGGDLAGLKGYENIRVFLNGPAAANGSSLGLPPAPHSKVTPEGAFRFPEIVADEYRVLVRGLSDDVYVKAVRYLDTDVLNRVFKLDRSGKFEVVLSRAGGRITGTLTDSTAQPLAFTEVVLLSTDGSLFKRTTTDADGAFSMRGIAPGDYRVFGWSDDSFGYFDPRVRPAIESSISKVTVSESSGTTVKAIVVAK